MKRSSKEETEINNKIGLKIKELRLSSGMSRSDLGKALSVTHQQLSKYERGVDRLSAAKFIQLSYVFGVTISSLWDESIKGIRGNERKIMEISRNASSLPSHLVSALLNISRDLKKGPCNRERN